MNEYMLGTIALGVVIVDAPAGDPLAFTPGQLRNVAIEIYLGIELLNLLAVQFTPTRQRAFTYNVQFERVQVSPTPGLLPPTGGSGGATESQQAMIVNQEIIDREPHWRDPALLALRLGTGAGGIGQHNSNLLARAWPGGNRARWAYTLFVTRYPAGWMSYASGGLGYAVLQYDWLTDTSGNFAGTGVGGWGPFGIDRAFAHETAHVFGALDEYRRSACSVTNVSSKRPLANGFVLSAPNGNCEVDNPAPVSAGSTSTATAGSTSSPRR
jgi:hypothetical protein